MSTIGAYCRHLPPRPFACGATQVQPAAGKYAASIFTRDPQTADQEQAKRDKSNPGEFIRTIIENVIRIAPS